MSVKCPKCHHDNPDDTFYCGKCTTPLKSAEDIDVTATIEAPKEELTTGSNFAGRYQIIEEIGKGGMGRVYKVQDTKIKEKIALKLIKPEISKDKKTIERFSNELRLARKIRHKNVCQMFDLGEEHGTQFITMEYVSGEDLRSSIRRFGQLPIAKSIAIAGQICEGLAEAHRQGVVHRDLKSNNIMIDRDGNVRIMDFGIARSLETKGITGAGMMIGTPEYMSPEQVEGKEVDHRSDVYSLGIILYEMVTGRLPFEGDTPFTVGMKHKSEIPQNPKELNAQIPDNLNCVILRCLEKEKGSRYQSADEVRSELSQIEKGIPTTEKAIPPKKPLTSREITVTFGIKKLLVPAIAIIAVIIIGIILWQVLPKKEVIPLLPTDKPVIAVMYFDNNTGDEGLDNWRKGLSDLLITDLSQSKFLYALSGDRIFSILDQMGILEAKSYSTENLEEVVRRGKATHILSGNYTKAGDIFRVNSMLREAATGRLIASEDVSGQGEESFYNMVDEITRRVKKSLELTPEEIAQDTDREIGEITTSFPEAYKYYSDGRIRHMTGDYEGSIALMEKAIEIDPEFAMAYRSLGVSYRNLGNLSKERENLQKAFELSGRVSEKERYLIQGYYYGLSEKTYDKAIEAYENLLEISPGDSVWQISLGLVYSYLEEWEKAIEHHELSRQENVDPFFTHANLAMDYANMGRQDKAREVLQDYLKNQTESVMFRWWLGYTYLWEEKLEEALREAERLFKLDPTGWEYFNLMGSIQIVQGNFGEAEKQYQKLLDEDDPENRLHGLEGSAYLSLLQGKFSDAENEFKQAMEQAKNVGNEEMGWALHLNLVYVYLSTGRAELAMDECETLWEKAIEEENLMSQRLVLLFKGFSYLALNSFDEAQRTAADLKALIEEGMNKKAIRYYFLLMGRIAMEQRNFSEAVKFLGDAIPLISSPFSEIQYHAIFHDSLAGAYLSAGDQEAALKEYKLISTLIDGRVFKGDIYARSFYMLGKIYEEQGEKAKAIENYEKFLDLWKYADPDLPEVDDARTRLSALKTK